MKKFYIGFIFTIILALVAGRYLLYPGYFDMHDDLQVTRQLEMSKCFDDGQIPCRWSLDLGAGYGFPMFNYYSPLPNYTGMLFRWLGFSYMATVKILFLIGLLGSGVFMYLFVFGLSSSVVGAVVSAGLYLWAPYHALDIFVRGAMAESWALMWFPLILWGIYRLQKKRMHGFLIMCLSIAGLYLSHNIMSMWFTPIILFWIVIVGFLKKENKKRFWIDSFLSFLLAIGLAAFFIVPALVEKNLIHSETLTNEYFNFRNHFVTIKQLFWDREWGFGASRFGPKDGMSFQIGRVNLGIAVVAILFYLRKILPIFKSNAKKSMLNVYLFGFFIVLFLGSMLMTHARSIYIWELFPFLAWTQFPWRVLALTIFSTSILGGLLVGRLKNRQQWFLGMGAIGLIIIMNWNYFVPKNYKAEAVDADKLEKKAWDIQRRGALLDYLPKTVKTFEVYIPKEQVKVFKEEKGKVIVKGWQQRSDFFSFKVETYEIQNDYAVQISIFDFPGWNMFLDNKPISYTSNNELGLITIKIPSGNHYISGKFTNTSIRNFANTITFLSYLILLYIAFNPRKNK